MTKQEACKTVQETANGFEESGSWKKITPLIEVKMMNRKSKTEGNNRGEGEQKEGRDRREESVISCCES